MSVAHEALVAGQFGPRARAYVESADHANGADLARLAALVAARPGSRVLDLGCGGGHVTYAVAPHAGEVVAYDLSADMLAAVSAEARARGIDHVSVVRGMAEALPFEADEFDFVFTRMSAHHWHDVGAGLAAMRRVLRPDGTAVVVDVVGPDDNPLHDTFLQAVEILRDPSHVRDYSPSEWVDMLRAAGFTPSAPVSSKLRLRFADWIARMATPEVQIRAIRALQSQMPPDVVERFAITEDGSFTLDVVTIEAHP